ncbi:MAG: acyl carrier protein [Acidimicrobiales bacterium]
MARDEAFGRFQKAIAEVLDVDATTVVREARWAEDLDADSLAVVEITLVLADEFHIQIPDVEPEELQTVGQAFDLVATLLGI